MLSQCENGLHNMIFNKYTSDFAKDKGTYNHMAI